MVASVAALRVRCASEFSTPHDERVLQKPALLEICEQACDGLIHGRAVCLERVAEVEMLVPVAVAGIRGIRGDRSNHQKL